MARKDIQSRAHPTILHCSLRTWIMMMVLTMSAWAEMNLAKLWTRSTYVCAAAWLLSGPFWALWLKSSSLLQLSSFMRSGESLMRLMTVCTSHIGKPTLLAAPLNVQWMYVLSEIVFFFFFIPNRTFSRCLIVSSRFFALFVYIYIYLFVTSWKITCSDLVGSVFYYLHFLFLCLLLLLRCGKFKTACQAEVDLLRLGTWRNFFKPWCASCLE